MLQLSELDQIRRDVYDNAKFYREKTKVFHDKVIIRKLLIPRHKVLSYKLKLYLFSRTLSSR